MREERTGGSIHSPPDYRDCGSQVSLVQLMQSMDRGGLHM